MTRLLERRGILQYRHVNPPLWIDTFDVDDISNYAGNTSSFSINVGQKRILPNVSGSGPYALYVPSLPAIEDIVVVATLVWFSGRQYNSILIKRIDAGNFIMGMIDSDSSYLKIYEFVGGTPTMLYQTGIGAPGIGADNWLVGVMQGSNVKLHAYAADPSLGGSPAVSSGLVAVDSSIGADHPGIPGGLRFNNLDNNDCYADNLRIYHYGDQPFVLP